MAKNPRDMREAGAPPRNDRVVVHGRDSNGHYYKVGSPPRIELCYAWGSASQALGNGEERALAKRLLKQIVAARPQ